MAYTRNWDETDPDGSIVAAEDIDREIRELKIDLRERLEQVIPDWSDDSVDPKTLIAGVPQGKVRKNSTQSIPDSTDTVVTWQTEVSDIGDWIDLAADDTIFTIPTDGGGIWLITLSITWLVALPTGADGNIQANLYVDTGSGFVLNSQSMITVDEPDGHLGTNELTELFVLEDGWQMKVEIFQDSGQTLDINFGNFTSLSFVRIGRG